jgi:hypothetical protein
MKIALCISGLPRNVEAGFPNILENIIKPNNPDIFIHTWGTDENLKNKIIELYQPKSLVFEEQKPFINDSLDLTRMMLSHGQSYTREKFVEMVCSSWYSVQASNTLKEELDWLIISFTITLLELDLILIITFKSIAHNMIVIKYMCVIDNYQTMI